MYHTEKFIAMLGDFEGPYPERVYIPTQYILNMGLDQNINDRVDKFYSYVDMIYSMFFERRINPYTGQPYVTNPRLSPNNIYTAQYILDNWEFKYGILYDLPTKVPGEYETVELMIKFPFNLRYRHWTDSFSFFLELTFMKETSCLTMWAFLKSIYHTIL